MVSSAVGSERSGETKVVMLRVWVGGGIFSDMIPLAMLAVPEPSGCAKEITLVAGS